MDPVLAQLYGTNQPVQPSAEEEALAAQIDVLEKVAAANDIDINQLTDDQLIEAVGELQKVASQAQPEVVANNDQAAADMFQTFDTAGRVVAHSMWNEIEKIAAQAMAMQEQEQQEQPINPLVAALYKEAGVRERVGQRVLGAMAGTGKGAGKRLDTRAGTAAIGTAAAVPAAFAIGRASKRGAKEEDEKAKEGYDQMVATRAYELLAEQGLVYEDGSVVTPDELNKMAASQVDVDRAALQLLENNGYEVQWNQ